MRITSSQIDQLQHICYQQISAANNPQKPDNKLKMR